MNVIICDDDLVFIENLRILLEEFFLQKNIMASYAFFQSGVDFLNWHQNISLEHKNFIIDFLFMDVEMPGLKGLETLKRFRLYDQNCIIFIISSYSKYVFDSFEAEPLQFLVKPIDPSNLYSALQRGLTKRSTKRQKISLDENNKHFYISYSDIISIESNNRMLSINTINGTFKAKKNISELDTLLTPYNFLRTHKSFLINMDKVLYYEGNTFHLLNGFAADISHRKRAEIINKFNLFMLNQKL